MKRRAVLAGGFCCMENARCDFEKNLYVTEHTYRVTARKFSNGIANGIDIEYAVAFFAQAGRNANPNRT